MYDGYCAFCYFLKNFYGLSANLFYSSQLNLLLPSMRILKQPPLPNVSSPACHFIVLFWFFLFYWNINSLCHPNKLENSWLQEILLLQALEGLSELVNFFGCLNESYCGTSHNVLKFYLLYRSAVGQAAISMAIMLVSTEDKECSRDFHSGVL